MNKIQRVMFFGLITISVVGWTFVFTFSGCKGAYPEEKYSVDYLIFGDDTIVVKGAKSIDYSKLKNFYIHGRNDTVKEITYTIIFLNTKVPEGVDNLMIHSYSDGDLLKYDTIHDIKIGTQNGDIITGDKNVYK